MSQKTLRERFDNGEQLLGIGVVDAMAAKIVQKLGYDMVFLASGPLNKVWAMPDGYISPREIVDNVMRVRDVVDIPIIIDMEQGYGGPREAAYWVRQLEKAGASLVFVTDFPQVKTMGIIHLKEGHGLAEPEEHAEIIKAMVDASDELVIGARTWSGRITGTDDAIRRLRIYKEAGADMLWAHYPKDLETLRRYRRELEGPLAIQTVTQGYFSGDVAGVVPQLSFKQLKDESMQLILITGTFKLPYLALIEAYEKMIRSDNVKCLEKRLADSQPYDDILTELDAQTEFDVKTKAEKAAKAGKRSA